MGLFSSKKKVYTSTSVYNMAGDIKDRPNVLKTTILSQAMNNTFSGYGDCLSFSYLNGQGMKMRSFSKWVDKSGYRNATGMVAPTVTYNSKSSTALSGLEEELSIILDTSLSIKSIDIGYGQLEWWGDEYISENRVDLIGKNYTTDMDDMDNYATIRVYADDDEKFEFPLESIDFYPHGYDPESEYLYVSYVEELDRVEGETTYFGINIVPEFTSITGWKFIEDKSAGKTQILNKYKITTTTYSDSTPTSVVQAHISNTYTYDPQITSEYEKRTPLPSFGGQLEEKVEKKFRITTKSVDHIEGAPVVTEETVDGVVITTSVVTYTPFTYDLYQEQLTTRDDLKTEWTTPRLFFYIRNSGNEFLDTFFDEGTSTGNYFPIMPIKYGPFLSETFNPTVFELNKKGLRKLTGKSNSYRKMVDSLMENPDIWNINHIYTMFGASINTKDMAAKRYIFDFFNNFYLSDQSSLSNLNSYINSLTAVRTSVNNWKLWFDAQKNISNPLYDKPQPTVLPYPTLPRYSFVLRNNFNFAYTLKWSSVAVTDGVGIHEEGAKVGTVTIKKGSTLNIQLPFIDTKLGLVSVDDINLGGISITLQTGSDTWRRITVNGLKSFNHVHKGKGDSLNALKEMDNAEESGLIIPLNEAAFKNMGIVKGTQFTTANTYLIMNSYKVVKKKWYQSGWFKIVIVVITVIVSIILTPAAGAGVAGVFGTATATGVAIGFAAGSVAAIIAGSIANVIAALIITKVITAASMKLFGDKIGSIIGAIISIITLNIGTSLANGQGWAANLDQIMGADNLLKLTNSVSQAFIADMAMKTEKLVSETEATVADYEKEAKRIQDLYDLNFGLGNGVDIKAITELASKFEFKKENSEAFLSRTLLTGTDIAQLSQDMIDKFASMTTALILE